MVAVVAEGAAVVEVLVVDGALVVVVSAAMDVVVVVYDLTSRFPTSERFGLTSQLRRAAISVVSQIAEGQGRLTYGEQRQFLSHEPARKYEGWSTSARCSQASPVP